VTETAVAEVMAELAALEDRKIRLANQRHGDDHGVNLGRLRDLAKRLKTQHERGELDAMLRAARSPKVQDWLVNYVVNKSPHAEQLRVAWSADPDPAVASAGWALTTERVIRNPDGLDLAALLEAIEANMKAAPPRLQWAMNECLGQIGIEHAEHRDRVIDIGERLGVLKDYPTPPGCTSPFVPIWVGEMVRRQAARAGG
jgi:3-methyladenine DNA glycosylase AlkD